jgi:hypothetical protein
MAKRGRPSKYRDAFARKMGVAARLGATDEQIAEILGVSVDSITRWKQKHPEFCGALKAGKDEADNRVEMSLFQRATGYSHPDVHVSNYQGNITLTPITKHYAPDTTAAIFWLKNRRPQEWRDRQELTGKDGEPLIPKPDERDLAKWIAFKLSAAIQQ